MPPAGGDRPAEAVPPAPGGWVRLRKLAPDGPIVRGQTPSGRPQAPRGAPPATTGRVMIVAGAGPAPKRATGIGATASTAAGTGGIVGTADLPGTPAAPGEAVTTFLVAYDIEREAVRRRVAETCQDYGLARIQWSVFMGPLKTRYHAEVVQALARRIAGEAGTIDCFMICAADVTRRRRLDGASVPVPARPARGRATRRPAR